VSQLAYLPSSTSNDFVHIDYIFYQKFLYNAKDHSLQNEWSQIFISLFL